MDNKLFFALHITDDKTFHVMQWKDLDMRGKDTIPPPCRSSWRGVAISDLQTSPSPWNPWRCSLSISTGITRTSSTPRLRIWPGCSRGNTTRRSKIVTSWSCRRFRENHLKYRLRKIIWEVRWLYIRFSFFFFLFLPFALERLWTNKRSFNVI